MRFTVATKVTLIRMLLVPFIAMGILYHRYGWTLVLFMISGITDLLDGLIARKFHQRSRTGALLDPIADKLLLATSFILLTLPGTGIPVPIPMWLTVVVFGRDIIIVVSSAAIAITTGFKQFDPTFYGKASTVVQIGCVVAVLVVNYLQAERIWVQWLFFLTFGLTLFSGLHYIFVFTKRFSSVGEETDPGQE